MADIEFTHLRAALEDFGVAVRNAYQDNLIRSGRIATGDLLNSVEVRVDGPDGGTWSVVLNLEEYWKYVEEDTKPHWPPRDAILRWIQAKPVIPQPDSHGRLPTPQSLAFLIQRKISKVGTTGSHDLERAKEELIPAWETRIQDALLEDLTAGLDLGCIASFLTLELPAAEL